MSTKRRTFIRALIIELVFFAILHSLLSTGLYAFFASPLPVLLTLALAVPYFGMYAIRGARGFPLFLGVHIALTAWPLLLPAFWTPGATLTEARPHAPLSHMLIGVPHAGIAPLRVCWFVFLCFSAIRSISVRLRGRRGFDVGYLFFAVGLFTALSLISGYFDMRVITSVVALWAFVVILGYLLYNQTARIDESLEIFSASGRKPVSAIVRFNNAILSVFFIPVALFAALSPWLPLGRVTRLLGAAGFAALRALFTFINWLLSLFPGEEGEIAPETPPPEQDMGMMGEVEENPAWLELLETIVNVLLAVACVALVAAGIAYGAYRLYKRFLATRGTGGGDGAEGDTSEYIGPRLAAKSLSEALGGMLRRLAPKSESEKVRRAYFKKVRRHIRRGAAIDRTDTAGEILEKLRPLEDIGELTAMYERARYGNETLKG